MRTVAMVKRALKLLKDARDIAGVMAQSDICIYSFTRTYGEMIPVAEFVQHMEKSIKMIEEHAGVNLYSMEDSDIIYVSGDQPPLLMTLNLCTDA